MKIPWYLMAKGKGGGTKTASGPIAHWTDGVDASLKSLLVNIDPVQGGTGDPSPDNVRPISGWSAVNVWRTGKNLLDVDKYGITLPRTQNGITWSKVRDGVYHASGTATGASYFNLSFYSDAQSAMPCISFRGQRMTLSSTDVHIKPSIGYFAEDGSFKQLSNGGIIPDNAVGLRAYIRIEKDTAIDTDFSVQLELGSTATDYEPYQGETYSITFPTSAGTVYGGTLDVTNGVLTVDRAMVDLGTLTWQYASDDVFFTSGLYGIKKPGINNYINSTYGFSDASFANMPDKTMKGNTNAGGIYVKDSAFGQNPNTAKTGLSGVQLVYELATPIEYTLTPQQISSLVGENNVWADTGEVTVEYESSGGSDPNLMKLAVAFMGRE